MKSKEKKVKNTEAEETAAETPVETEETDAAAGKNSNEWQESEEIKEETPAEPEETPLEKALREAAEINAKYLYLQAEYQNYRKRVAKELSDARAYAVADTLGPFLTVYDFLNMADNAAVASDNIESIRQGLKMIINEFNKALDEQGVKQLETANAKFDPDLHEAVANQPSDTVPEGVIIKQWSSGFKIGEKLLRPARVVVSSGPENSTAEESPAKEE